MKTKCSKDRFSCKSLGPRGVVARFDGGDITSDGGAILLRELEAKTGIIRRFAACFTDHRDPDRIEHTVGDLVAQRVYGLALGYEGFPYLRVFRAAWRNLQRLAAVVREAQSPG